MPSFLLAQLMAPAGLTCNAGPTGTCNASDYTWYDANTLPQAIIEPVSGGTMHFVGVGDDIDSETLIVNIQAMSVTLETKGHQRMLSLETSLFLNAERRVGVVRQKHQRLCLVDVYFREISPAGSRLLFLRRVFLCPGNPL